MINNPDYTFYVVVNGKIESGWEYKEDAQDQLGELPDDQKGKVYSKRHLARLNLDPGDNASWIGNESKIDNVIDNLFRRRNMSEFNRSKNERVRRMGKFIEAARGKDEKKLNEEMSPGEEGEMAARQDARDAKTEKKPRAKVTKEMLQTHGKSVYKLLDRFYDTIVRAQSILDKGAKRFPDDVRSAFALTRDAKTEKKPRAKVAKEMLQTHGKSVYKLLDRFYDTIVRAQSILDKGAKRFPDDVRSAFALTQDDLDGFSDNLDDFVLDQGYDPGMIDVELENIRLGAYDD